MSGALLQILKQQAVANEKQDSKVAEETLRGSASSRHRNKQQGFNDLRNLHSCGGTAATSATTPNELFSTATRTSSWLDDEYVVSGGGVGGTTVGLSRECSLAVSGSASPMLDSIMLELNVELPEVARWVQDRAHSGSLARVSEPPSGLPDPLLVRASSRRSADIATRRTYGSNHSSVDSRGRGRTSLQRDLGVLQGAKIRLVAEQQSRNAEEYSDALVSPLPRRVSRVSFGVSCASSEGHGAGASQGSSAGSSPNPSVRAGNKLHRLQRNSVVLDVEQRGDGDDAVGEVWGSSGSALALLVERVDRETSRKEARESDGGTPVGGASEIGVEFQPWGGASLPDRNGQCEGSGGSLKGQGWDAASACGGLSNAEAQLTRDLEAEQHSCWDALDRLSVFRPTHPVKATWDWLIVTLVLYVAVMVPFQATFLVYALPFSPHPPAVPQVLSYWDIAVDCAFILDVIMNFNTGFTKQDGTFITSHRAISKTYIKSFFVVDFVSSVPIDWFLTGEAVDVGALALVKCIRLLRLGRLMKKLDQMRSANIFRIIKLLLFFTIIAHWAACLWYLFGQQSGGLSWIALIAETLDSQGRAALAGDVMYWYMLSLYWSLTTLTTVGYGDITPVSSGEVWYTISVELIGVVVSAVITGQVAVLLAAYEAAYGRYHHNIELFNMFIYVNALPEGLSMRMLNCIDYFFDKNSGLDLLSVISQVSPGLQAEVQLTMYGDLLMSVHLLRDMPEGVIKCILGHVKHEEYFTEDYVIRAGDPIRGMFIVHTGRMEVLVPNQGMGGDGGDDQLHHRQEESIYRRGELIGVTEMAFSAPFTSHVRCLEPTELLFIATPDLSEALELSPEFRKTFHDRLQSSARKNVDATRSASHSHTRRAPIVIGN